MSLISGLYMGINDVVARADLYCIAVLTTVGDLYEDSGTEMRDLNPMGIATNANGGATSIQEQNELSLVRLLGLNDLYQLMKRDGLIIATIMVLVLLASMLFVHRSDKLADKKADIMHKLGIVFIICSLIWILNIVVAILDSMF